MGLRLISVGYSHDEVRMHAEHFDDGNRFCTCLRAKIGSRDYAIMMHNVAPPPVSIYPACARIQDVKLARPHMHSAVP